MRHSPNSPTCRWHASARCCTTVAATACTRCFAAPDFREATFAAFQVALDACHEQGFVDTADGAARLRRRMVERVLTHCETDRGATEPLMVLLRRFATEFAREEARLFCDELVAEDALDPVYDDLIAA